MINPNYFLTALFVIATYWMGILYQPFLLVIIVASMLAIATSNIYNKLLTITRKPLLASTISSLLLALLFFAPLGYFIGTIAGAVQYINADTVQTIIDKIEVWIATMPKWLEFLKPHITSWLSSVDIAGLAGDGLAIAAQIGKRSAGFVKDALLIIIFYFFVLLYGKAIVHFIKRLIPLMPRHTNALIYETSNVLSIVFYSIITTAIFEGALFAIIAYWYGYDGLLLGIMYGFASLIPVVGGIFMWLPLALYEFSYGSTVNAIVIAIYTIVVISIIADTFIKPIIIKYIDKIFIKTTTAVNELLIFFAILAGLATFGFWGMIIGPAITAFFVALVKLYIRLNTKKTNT